MRRAGRLPRPGHGVARVPGEPLHGARDPDLHLRPNGGERCAQARTRAGHAGIARGTRARATGQPDRRRMRAVQVGELGRPAAEPVLPGVVRAARRQPVDRRPVWFMRQAGRSLPEYRKVRERYDLFKICQNPELCAEVTMQPVRRLGVDGAVVFADIMLPVAFGLGVDLQLVDGVGPVVQQPIRTRQDIDRLQLRTPAESVPFVMETIRLLRRELDPSVAVIGFSGAPFTLAGYLIEGKPSREFLTTKRLMYSEPALWDALMARLCGLVVDYLLAQVEAGAQVVQVFDSWVGCLSPMDYRRYVLPSMTGIFAGLQRAGVPSIHFATGTAGLLSFVGGGGGDGIGLDLRGGVCGAPRGGRGNPAPPRGTQPPPLLGRPPALGERAPRGG